jgi:hypothetical protein
VLWPEAGSTTASSASNLPSTGPASRSKIFELIRSCGAPSGPLRRRKLEQVPGPVVAARQRHSMHWASRKSWVVHAVNRSLTLPRSIGKCPSSSAGNAMCRTALKGDGCGRWRIRFMDCAAGTLGSRLTAHN